MVHIWCSLGVINAHVISSLVTATKIEYNFFFVCVCFFSAPGLKYTQSMHMDNIWYVNAYWIILCNNLLLDINTEMQHMFNIKQICVKFTNWKQKKNRRKTISLMGHRMTLSTSWYSCSIWLLILIIMYSSRRIGWYYLLMRTLWARMHASSFCFFL